MGHGDEALSVKPRRGRFAGAALPQARRWRLVRLIYRIDLFIDTGAAQRFDRQREAAPAGNRTAHRSHEDGEGKRLAGGNHASLDTSCAGGTATLSLASRAG